MLRRPHLLVLLALVLGLTIGGSAAGAATPNDAACRKVVSGSVSQEELLAYDACRFDRLDAQVAALKSVVAPLPTSSPTTVKPTSSPTTVKPTATSSPTVVPQPSPTTAPTSVAAFPSAATTGVPAGLGLTQYTGPTTISAAGTVIDGKRITNCLVVKANDVTIRNSLVSGDCFFNVLNDAGNTNLQLIDVEIDGMNANSTGAGIGGREYTCLRCDIHGTGDGLKLGDNVTVQDSWIHDLYGASDSHNDGMQASDGTNIRVVHNTITPVFKGSTSAIIIKADFGAISNLVFDGNLVGGGAYTVYAGDGYGSGIPDATGVKITNNRFTTAYFAKGGAFGAITNTGSGVSVAGNQWADGAGKGTPVVG